MSTYFSVESTYFSVGLPLGKRTAASGWYIMKEAESGRKFSKSVHLLFF